MAWKARLAQEITVAGDKVFADVEFYDDADTETVLHTEGFAFPPDWSNADMQAAIQARGKAARAARTRATALAVAFPAATTVINIP